MPAFGFSAVPSPIHTRTKSASGFGVADALGDVSVNGLNGSLVDVDAAGDGVAALRPTSRRVNANAVHINGAATGTSPVLPPASHPNRPLPIPVTALSAETARGAAVITGAAAAAGTATEAIAGVAEAGAAVSARSGRRSAGVTTGSAGAVTAVGPAVTRGATGACCGLSVTML
jgi:hypothetical protein